jgi:hypothetical protein
MSKTCCPVLACASAAGTASSLRAWVSWRKMAITDLLWKEMREIYYGRNIPAV